MEKLINKKVSLPRVDVVEIRKSRFCIVCVDEDPLSENERWMMCENGRSSESAWFFSTL